MLSTLEVKSVINSRPVIEADDKEFVLWVGRVQKLENRTTGAVEFCPSCYRSGRR